MIPKFTGYIVPRLLKFKYYCSLCLNTLSFELMFSSNFYAISGQTSEADPETRLEGQET